MIQHQLQGAVHVLSIEPALNQSEGEALAEAVLGRAGGGASMIVLDLSGVSLVNSAGLDRLLSVRESARKCGGQIRLASASAVTRDVLRATGIGEYFEQFETVGHAVRSYAR